jgi:hypothetical protein
MKESYFLNEYNDLNFPLNKEAMKFAKETAQNSEIDVDD